MILADTIKCTIPSDNAVKLKELYCNVAYPVASADSQTWATWATAVFTLLLAVFAFIAWRTSRKTLAKMEDQIRTQENRAIDERQHAYLVDYLLALKTLANSMDETDVDWESLKTNATDTWMVWSMDLLRDEPEMHELTGKANVHYTAQFSYLHERWKNHEGPALGLTTGVLAKDIVPAVARKNAEEIFAQKVSVLGYLQDLQRWETTRASRQEIYERLASKFDAS